MAGVEKVLPIRWVEQAKSYFCGPAVAQMFLKYFARLESQQDLWTDIKNNTDGHRPKGAPLENTDPDFPKQRCDNCDGMTPPEWSCWNTTPEALQQTLRLRAPHVRTQVRYPTNFETGVEHLIESIDVHRTPALATETGMSHWVVVNGYLRDDRTSTQFPAQQVGKYLLNALYVVDSNGATDPDRFSFKTVAVWRADFGSIGCDAHVQAGNYPVVVGVSSTKRKKSVVVAASAVSAFVLWAWWRNRARE